MKIVLTPETTEEKEKFSKVEHEHVKEFMIFGNKVDSEGDMVDWHDWTGSYRYLFGSLKYFAELIRAEFSVTKNVQEVKIAPQSNKNFKLIMDQALKDKEDSTGLHFPT